MANRYSISATINAKDNISKTVASAGGNVRKTTSKMRANFKKVSLSVKKIGSVAKSAFSIVAKSAIAAVTGVGGLLFSLNEVNARIAEANLQSLSVGVDASSVDALALSLKPLGFGAENVIDLFEEMNNKIGESKGLGATTPVTEGLAMIGKKFSDIEKLSPEKQFEDIFNAALNSGDAQKAQSAIDMIFGAEGAKIFGSWSASGIKNIGALMAKFKELNFQTDASRKNATEYSTAMGKLSSAIGSGFQYAGGVIGKALTPTIDKLTKKLSGNKSALQTFIDGIADRISTAIDEIIIWMDGGEAIGFAKTLETALGYLNFMKDNWKIIASIVAIGLAAPLVVATVNMAAMLVSAGLLAVQMGVVAAGAIASALAFLSIPIIAAIIVVAILGLIALIVIFWDEIKEGATKAWEVMSSLFDSVVAFGKIAFKQLGEIIWDSITSAFDSAIRYAINLFPSISKALGIDVEGINASLDASQVQREDRKKARDKVDLVGRVTTNVTQVRNNVVTTFKDLATPSTKNKPTESGNSISDMLSNVFPFKSKSDLEAENKSGYVEGSEKQRPKNLGNTATQVTPTTRAPQLPSDGVLTIRDESGRGELDNKTAKSSRFKLQKMHTGTF